MIRNRTIGGRTAAALGLAALVATTATPALAQVCGPATICVTKTKYFLGFIVVSKTVECFEGEICTY